MNFIFNSIIECGQIINRFYLQRFLTPKHDLLINHKKISIFHSLPTEEKWKKEKKRPDIISLFLNFFFLKEKI